MLNPFKSLKSIIAPSYLGVDIGTTSIKIAEIAKNKKGPKLENYGILETYGHLERLNNAIQTSGLKIMEKETAELLKLLLRQLKIKSRDVIASLPAFSAFITLLEIPEMSEVDTAKTIPFQIRQHIPLPVSEVNIDWFKVGQKEEDGFTKQQILLISVPNDIIQRYQAIFKLAGLSLKILEVETLSLARALISGGAEAQAPTLLVDIGGRSTNIAVVENGFIKYNTHTEFAGGSLTQAISSGLSINIKRAEELKKQKGILGGGAELELSTLIFPFLDAIINEVKRVKTIFEKGQEIGIKRIILAGGGANLLGIEKYFEEQTGVETIIGNPFSKVEYPAKIEPMVRELGPSFGVAIGLGIREFI